jgi:hypothetical protein
MEVRDGFIESIYNYCDRWCEACALIAVPPLRGCREAQAALDPI